MTTDFEKQYQKKEKIKEIKNKMRVSWKDYRFYFFLFPLAFICWIKDNIYNRYYKSLHWNRTRADRVLNKVLPKVVKKDEKTDNFSFFLDQDNNKSIFLQYCNFIDKTWTKKNYYTLLNYLKCQYCPKNYTKLLVDDFWIIFIKKT